MTGAAGNRDGVRPAAWKGQPIKGRGALYNAKRDYTAKHGSWRGDGLPDDGGFTGRGAGCACAALSGIRACPAEWKGIMPRRMEARGAALASEEQDGLRSAGE